MIANPLTQREHRCLMFFQLTAASIMTKLYSAFRKFFLISIDDIEKLNYRYKIKLSYEFGYIFQSSICKAQQREDEVIWPTMSTNL